MTGPETHGNLRLLGTRTAVVVATAFAIVAVGATAVIESAVELRTKGCGCRRARAEESPALEFLNQRFHLVDLSALALDNLIRQLPGPGV